MTERDHSYRTRLTAATAGLVGAAVGLVAVGAGVAVGMSAPSRPTGAVVQPAAAQAAGLAPGGSAPITGPGLRSSVTVPATPVGLGPAGPGASAAGGDGAAAAGPAPAGGDGLVPLPVEVVAGGAGGTGPATAAPEPAPAGGAGIALPATGAYPYDTAGSTRLTLVGSDDLPARTRLVVTPGGCGESLEWLISAGNGRSLLECPAAGGVRVASETVSFSAHGYRDTQTFECGSGSYIPLTGRPGRNWQWNCSSGATVSHQSVALDGTRTVDVGGVQLSAAEVTVDSTLSGAETGTIRSVYLLASDGLPVHESTGEQITVDGLTYQSQYVLAMSSLHPS